MTKAQAELTSLHTLVGDYFVQAIAIETPGAEGELSSITPEIYRIGRVVGVVGEKTYMIEFEQFNHSIRNMTEATYQLVVGQGDWAHREVVTLEYFTGEWTRLYDNTTKLWYALPDLHRELDTWNDRGQALRAWRRTDLKSRYRDLAVIDATAKADSTVVDAFVSTALDTTPILVELAAS